MASTTATTTTIRIDIFYSFQPNLMRNSLGNTRTRTHAHTQCVRTREKTGRNYSLTERCSKQNKFGRDDDEHTQSRAENDENEEAEAQIEQIERLWISIKWILILLAAKMVWRVHFAIAATIHAQHTLSTPHPSSQSPRLLFFYDSLKWRREKNSVIFISIFSISSYFRARRISIERV